MSLKLEYAETMMALQVGGSVSKASKILNKTHSGVLYTLKNIESDLGSRIFDRQGYRTKLTPLGERVLDLYKRLLDLDNDLKSLSRFGKNDYEPFVKIVYDGLFPVAKISRCLKSLSEFAPYTKISLYADFLNEVYRRYQSEGADVMISILPPPNPGFLGLDLEPINAFLVCHKGHPLALRKKHKVRELQDHKLITVRGSDDNLRLSTAHIGNVNQYHVSDFELKKRCLMEGIGFGWMPQHLIAREIEEKSLRIISWTGVSKHQFFPKLYVRDFEAIGKVVQALIDELTH